jgi:hypothetical protein
VINAIIIWIMVFAIDVLLIAFSMLGFEIMPVTGVIGALMFIIASANLYGRMLEEARKK